MKKYLTSLSYSFLALGLTAANVHAGGFADVCKDIKLFNKNWLEATCPDNNGIQKTSQLNLCNYLKINNHGMLSWEINPSGHCLINCQEPSLNGSRFEVRCFDGINWMYPNSLELNDHVSNINGGLKFQ